MSNTLLIALTRLLDYISTQFSFTNLDPYDHYAACWVTLSLYSIAMQNHSHWVLPPTRGVRVADTNMLVSKMPGVPYATP